MDLSCLNCGVGYTAHPPDSLHEQCIAQDVQSEGAVKIKYTCRNCKTSNVLTWLTTFDFEEDENQNVRIRRKSSRELSKIKRENKEIS